MNLPRSKAQKTTSAGLNVGTWTQAEDDRLKEAVAKHGAQWVVVASHVGTRNGDQCAKRWNENLNPKLDHSPFRATEDKLLLHMIEIYGQNWKYLADNFFENRSPLSLKNRNSYLNRRRQKRQAQSSRAEQGQQQQTPPISKDTSPVLPPELSDVLDVSMRMNNAILPGGADDPHVRNNSGSNTDGEFPGPAHPNDMRIPPGPKQNPSSNMQWESTLSNNGAMLYDPDPVFWPPFMDTSFGPPADGEPGGILNPNLQPNGIPNLQQNAIPNLQHNIVPMLHGPGTTTANLLPTSGPGAVTPPNGADAVEYSLTCPRSQLNSLVQHIINEASTNTSLSDDQQVHLYLRLGKC